MPPGGRRSCACGRASTSTPTRWRRCRRWDRGRASSPSTRSAGRRRSRWTSGLGWPPRLERIDEIHDAALAQIGAAGTAAELEELRVRHLGRKAELPNLLRGVAQLPPAERGAVGKRANEVRRALE